MSLQVLVKSASSLPNVERFSKSDPVCIIVFQGEFDRAPPLLPSLMYLTCRPEKEN